MCVCDAPAQVEAGQPTLEDVETRLATIAASDDARAHGAFAGVGEQQPELVLTPMQTKGARKGAAARFQELAVGPPSNKVRCRR